MVATEKLAPIAASVGVSGPRAPRPAGRCGPGRPVVLARL